MSKVTKPVRNSSNYSKFITYFTLDCKKLITIKTEYPILQASEETTDVFEKSPRIIFRLPTNLKYILVHPKLPTSEDNYIDKKQRQLTM